MRTQKDKNYKIKVNRASVENKLSSPYNKYLKKDYKKFTKIDPKNPILYKVKYKPEIIINEYRQPSNNINIKTNRSGNSNSNNERNNYNNLGFQPNNIYFNDYNTEEYEFDNSIKNENNDKNYNNNDKSDNQDRAKNSDYISSKLNRSNESNSNEVIFSPFSNGYSLQSRESDTKRSKLKNNNNYEYNKKKPNYIFQSPIDSNNNKVNWNIPAKSDRNNYSHNKKNINHIIEIEDNDIYDSRNQRNNTNSRKKYDDDKNLNVCNALNYRKYNKRKEPVKTFANLYNKTVGSESSLDSFRAKKMNKMDNIVFSNINSLNNAIKSGFNSNNIISNSTINFNSNNSNNIDNSKESLNLKLENYRTRLFKEFYKHFEAFYKSYVIKNFIYFINKIKNYKKSIFKNNKSFIYTKKNNLRKGFMKNNYSSYKKIKAPISINNKIYGKDLFEIKKSSTMKDYYKLYNELRKNRNLSQSMNKINNIFNSYSFDTDNKYSNQKNNNKSVEKRIKNDNLLNSVPRLNKNLFNLSDKKKLENKNKSKNSKSPNKIIINNVLCFSTDGKIELDDQVKDENKNNRTVETDRRQKRYINSRDTRKISKPKKNNLNIRTLKDDIDENDYNMKFNRTYYNNNFRNGNDKNININRTKSSDKNGGNKTARTKKEVENDSKSNNNDYINLILKKINNIFNYKKNNNFKRNEEKKNDKEEYKKDKANNNNFVKKDNGKPYCKRWNKDNRIISNKNNSFVSILIKELSTSDKRINIRINYYEYIGKANNNNHGYDFLQKSENNSLTLFGGTPESKKYPAKLYFMLSSIKEEENSVQNSKFYDESETLGNLNENKRNYIIYHNNEIQVVNFIDAINNLLINIYKKNFMKNIKIFDKNNDSRKEENEADNISKIKNNN